MMYSSEFANIIDTMLTRLYYPAHQDSEWCCWHEFSHAVLVAGNPTLWDFES
jgi:hypothetical protein